MRKRRSRKSVCSGIQLEGSLMEFILRDLQNKLVGFCASWFLFYCYSCYFKNEVIALTMLQSSKFLQGLQVRGLQLGSRSKKTKDKEWDLCFIFYLPPSRPSVQATPFWVAQMCLTCTLVWTVSTVSDALPLLVTDGTALHASVPLHRAQEWGWGTEKIDTNHVISPLLQTNPRKKVTCSSHAVESSGGFARTSICLESDALEIGIVLRF